MSLHTLAFHAIVGETDLGSTSPQVLLKPVLDSAVASAGESGFVTPPGMFVVAAYCSATLTYTYGGARYTEPAAIQARFQTPSLFRVFPPNIEPVQGTPGETLPNMQINLQSPVKLGDNEILQVFAEVNAVPKQHTADVTAKSVEATVLLWLSDKLDPLPRGEVYWLPYSILLDAPTVTPPADDPRLNAWHPVDWSEELSLPAGRYAVVGMSGNGIIDTFGVSDPPDEFWVRPLSVRISFVDQRYCPGTVGVFPGPWGRTHDIFYNGDLGAWGTFDAFALPKLEVLLGTIFATSPSGLLPGRVSGAMAVIKVS